MFAAVVAVGLIAAPLPPLTQTAAPAKPAAKKAANSGQIAARERQKKCGAEWKEAKDADKVEKGMTWPKILEWCNKCLKAGT